MNESLIHILLVEDNSADARLLQEALHDAAPDQFVVTRVASLRETETFLSNASHIDVILLDLSLPDSVGIETVSRALAKAVHLPILVLTGLDDESLGLDAVGAGAQDYLVKGQLSAPSLVRAIRYATTRKRLEDELREARDKLEERVAQRTNELAQVVDELGAEVRDRIHAEMKLREVNEALDQRAAQLRALAVELTQTEERERRHLAQVLHDHLQQLLVAAKFAAGVMAGQTDETGKARAANRLMSLLDEAIEASRSLTVELSPSVLYEAGLMPALEWLARQTEEKHGLTVYVSADATAEPQSEETRVLLFQAVRELILNAVKHAHADYVEITTASAQDGLFQISVSDNGIGFDPDQKRSETERAGFGLFSIEERISLLNGSMTITSKPGCGTRVILETPLFSPGDAVPLIRKTEWLHEQETSSEKKAGTSPRTPDGRLRIMVVDDHKVVRQGLTGLVAEQPDMEVVGEANNGKTAVIMALELCPDVIIMDVTMPSLNGIEATRRIMAVLPQTRIIGLSMHSEQNYEKVMRDAGAAAYLVKGAPAEELLAAIRGK